MNKNQQYVLTFLFYENVKLDLTNLDMSSRKENNSAKQFRDNFRDQELITK